MRPAGILVALTSALFAASALADPVVVDATAVRFYAPETGGPAHPRFITQRILALQARLQAKVEDPALPATKSATSALRWTTTSPRSFGALPLERPPDEAEVARVANELREALGQRVGGEREFSAAAEAERISEREVAALVHRRARAALYVERQLSRVLYPNEEQLREVYRTASHPFKNVKFEDARERLGRWYVDERLRAAESAFLQGARTRVTIAIH